MGTGAFSLAASALVSNSRIPVLIGETQGMAVTPRRKPKQPDAKRLEDYEPGATREEVLSGLRKAVQPSKKPSELPVQASSKTTTDHHADANI